jgi:replicative DNA helicase
MTAEQLTRRLVSSVASVNYNSFSRGSLDDDEWARTSAAMGLLLESPLYIDESIFSTVEALRKKCIDFYSEHKLELIVIDSIQHLTPQSNLKDNSSKSIARQLKSLARELDIPVIITSSVPIEVEKRVSKRPILSDLSNCNELEEFSDTVLFIYQDAIYNDYIENTGEVELIVAKEMFNKLGVVKVNYNEDKYNFFCYKNVSK